MNEVITYFRVLGLVFDSVELNGKYLHVFLRVPYYEWYDMPGKAIHC